ncbi:MAG TPA: alpha/beta fold hydrolase [Coriobacteriia bacterium]
MLLGGRHYLVHVPRHHQGAMPLVLMLHGAGGNSRNAMRQAELARFADERGFLAVAPDGTAPHRDLPPQFIANPQVWNDGSERGHAYARGVDDVEFLSAVLDDVSRRHHVDPGRIYVMGFSNGGSMAFRLASERPERIAAVAAVAGHPFARPRPGDRAVPTICVGGTVDPLTPLPGGDIRLPWGGSLTQPPYVESIGWWAEAGGCHAAPARTRERRGVERLTWGGPDDPDGCARSVTLYLVEGAGHVWPGGSSFMPEVLVGADPGTLDATAVVLDHLFAHTL